jgi:tetratricopeptide (TPR) repeat protein
MADKPRTPAAHNVTSSRSFEIAKLFARGCQHHRAGQFAEAESCLKNVLSLDPNHFGGLRLLGLLAHQVGRSDVAVRLIGRAIALHDRDSVLRALDPSKAAARRRILAEAHSDLTIALMALGDLPAALKAVRRSLQLEETESAKLLFVGCLRQRFIPDGIELCDELTRALSEPWGRPNHLARFAAILIKRHGAISTCIRRITATWPNLLAPHELFSPVEFAEICDNRLLGCLLESTVVSDLELERFVTALRRTMLAAAIGGLGQQLYRQESLPFWCALAQQCFVNEYIFSCPDQEKQQAEELRERLVEALSTGASVPESWLAAVAAYFPLASLSEADLLIERRWSAPAAELVMRQVREVHEERRLRGSVPRLTAIDDSVSLAVRQQYEENPYPRWMKPSPIVQTTIEAYLRTRFPFVSLHKVVKTKGAEILIAGCGTG